MNKSSSVVNEFINAIIVLKTQISKNSEFWYFVSKMYVKSSLKSIWNFIFLFQERTFFDIFRKNNKTFSNSQPFWIKDRASTFKWKLLPTEVGCNCQFSLRPQDFIKIFMKRVTHDISIFGKFWPRRMIWVGPQPLGLCQSSDTVRHCQRVTV